MANADLSPEEMAAAEAEGAMEAETGEIPTAEEPTGTEQEVAAGGGLEISIEDIPELAGKREGDTIVMSIRGISDDGNMYTLVATGEEGSPVEPVPGAGREAIAAELTGEGTGA